MCFDCDHLLDRRSVLAGTGALALALSSTASSAASVGEPVSIPSTSGPIPGRLFRAAGRRRPLVIVTHGDPGFPVYLDGFCAVLAKRGYTALIIDWTHRFPPVPTSEGDRDTFFKAIGAYQFWNGDDLFAASAWAGARRVADTSRLAAIGFCGGGVVASHFATRAKHLNALILFHTPARHHGRFHNPGDPRPDLVDVAARIRAPVQAHCGLKDSVALTDDSRDFELALNRSGDSADFFYYAGAGHGFLQSDTPMNAEGTFGYAPEAARIATRRAHDFLDERVLA